MKSKNQKTTISRIFCVLLLLSTLIPFASAVESVTVQWTGASDYTSWSTTNLEVEQGSTLEATAIVYDYLSSNYGATSHSHKIHAALYDGTVPAAGGVILPDGASSQDQEYVVDQITVSLDSYEYGFKAHTFTYGSSVTEGLDGLYSFVVTVTNAADSSDVYEEIIYVTVVPPGDTTDTTTGTTITTGPDSDGDGVEDSVDNCPETSNPYPVIAGTTVPYQLDSDGDGYGNACDDITVAYLTETSVAEGETEGHAVLISNPNYDSTESIEIEYEYDTKSSNFERSIPSFIDISVEETDNVLEAMTSYMFYITPDYELFDHADYPNLEDTFTIYATVYELNEDGSRGHEETFDFEVTLTDTNREAEANSCEITINEDEITTYDLTSLTSDADSDDLIYSEYVNFNSWITIASDGLVTLDLQNNEVGADYYSFFVQATEYYPETSTQTGGAIEFECEVNIQREDPELTASGTDVAVNEGDEGTSTVTIENPSSSTSTFTIELARDATTTIHGEDTASTIIGYPVSLAAGDLDFDVTVEPGFDIINHANYAATSSLEDSFTVYATIIELDASGAEIQTITTEFKVDVTDVNQEPEADTCEASIVQGEYEELNIAATAADDDYDTLYYSFTGLDSTWMSISSTVVLELDLTTTEIAAGDYAVDVVVEDYYPGTATAAGASISYTCTITVTEEANTAPTLTMPGDVTVTEGYTISESAEFSDDDGDILIVSVTGIDSAYYTIDSSTGQVDFDWETGEGDAGTYDVTVTVTDGTDTASGSFTINIEEATTNTAPYFTGLTDLTIVEGAYASFTFTVTDDEGDEITDVYINGEPSAVTITNNGDGTYTFEIQTNQGDYDSIGDRLLTIVAVDEHSAEGTDSFAIYLLIDTDGDLITDDEDNCPEIANEDQTDSDGNGVGDACEDGNEAPVITEITDDSTTEGNSVTFTTTVTDNDGTVENIEIAGLEDLSDDSSVETTYDETTGELTITVNTACGDSDYSSYDVTVTATDDDGAQTSTSFTLTVDNSDTCVVVSDNNKPILYTTVDQTLEEGESVTIEVSFKDADADDTLTLSYSGLPDDVTYEACSDDGQTYCFTWVTEEGDAGVYTWEFAVSDGESTTTSEVEITVVKLDLDETQHGTLESLIYTNVMFDNEEVRAGDYALLTINMQNNGYIDLEDMQAFVTIPELGRQFVSSSFDVEEDETVSIQVPVYIDSNAHLDQYLVKIAVSGDQYSHQTYRELRVI